MGVRRLDDSNNEFNTVQEYYTFGNIKVDVVKDRSIIQNLDLNLSFDSSDAAFNETLETIQKLVGVHIRDPMYKPLHTVDVSALVNHFGKYYKMYEKVEEMFYANNSVEGNQSTTAFDLFSSNNAVEAKCLEDTYKYRLDAAIGYINDKLDASKHKELLNHLGRGLRLLEVIKSLKNNESYSHIVSNTRLTNQTTDSHKRALYIVNN